MTGPDRRRLIGMLAVLVAFAAVVSAVVAAAGDRPRPSDRLEATGAGAGAGDVTDSTVALPGLTTTTTATSEPEATTSTSTVPLPAATRAGAPPSTAAPAPSTTTTAGAPALPPAVLDAGRESCTADRPAPIQGSVVGVILPDGIHEVSLDGSRDVLVPDSANASGPAWSADGSHLAFTRASSSRSDANHYAATDLVVVDLDRGCSRVLAPRGADSLMSPAWTADGSKVSYVRSVSGSWSNPRALETARSDGSGVVRLAEGNVLGASWAPDGSGRVAYGQDGGLRVQDRNGKVTVVDATTGGAEFQSWSPDSTKLVYAISVHQGIWVANADGSGYRDLSPKGTSSPNGIFWSRFAPDGRHLAFGWGVDAWVIDADGTNATKRAAMSGPGGPWWSPAGDELVYPGDGGVRAIAADGSSSSESRLVHAGQLAAVFRRS